jgi:hypothetical protein
VCDLQALARQEHPQDLPQIRQSPVPALLLLLRPARTRPVLPARADVGAVPAAVLFQRAPIRIHLAVSSELADCQRSRLAALAPPLPPHQPGRRGPPPTCFVAAGARSPVSTRTPGPP